MSLPRTVAEILRAHVTLEVAGIDRMYLNGDVPGLQHESGVAVFFRRHRGQPFASSALMDPISNTVGFERGLAGATGSRRGPARPP